MGLKHPKWGSNLRRGMGLKRNTGKCFWPDSGLQRKSELKLKRCPLHLCQIIWLLLSKMILPAHQHQTISYWEKYRKVDMSSSSEKWLSRKVNQLVFPKPNQPISKAAKVFSAKWAVWAGAEIFPRFGKCIFSPWLTYILPGKPTASPLLQTPSYRVILGVD